MNKLPFHDHPSYPHIPHANHRASPVRHLHDIHHKSHVFSHIHPLNTTNRGCNQFRIIREMFINVKEIDSSEVLCIAKIIE